MASTSEILAYLWGQEQARQACELLFTGGDPESWLNQEPTDAEQEVAGKLGPVKWAYWVNRGYTDFARQNLRAE